MTNSTIQININQLNTLIKYTLDSILSYSKSKPDKYILFISEFILFLDDIKPQYIIKLYRKTIVYELDQIISILNKEYKPSYELSLRNYNSNKIQKEKVSKVLFKLEGLRNIWYNSIKENV